MAKVRTIRGKAENSEGQLKKRVRALEREVKRLAAKVGKKESEIKKLKDRMRARQLKGIRKKVQDTGKKIRKLVPGIR